ASALGYEYHQKSHFTVTLNKQRSQAAVRAERSDRRIGRPASGANRASGASDSDHASGSDHASDLRNKQPDAVRHEAHLLRGQLQMPERCSGGLSQRNELELVGQLIERFDIFHQKKPDPDAAQRRKITAGAQSRAKVAGDNPDVR